MARFISYLRVSTGKQGRSGLGLEAQRDAVERFLAQRDGVLVREYLEVETGSKNDRAVLAEAFEACRVHRATLVIAKLDRLSRNAAFLLALRDAGVDFVVADMPDANRLTVGILALVAEQEREAISARTKAALDAAKRRGVKLGKPENLRNQAAGRARGAAARAEAALERASDLKKIIDNIVENGVSSLSGIARELNTRQVPTSGGTGWQPTQVKRVLDRLR